MMNNTFSILIAGTIAGSILFGITLCLDWLYSRRFVKYVYCIVKGLLIYYFFPIVLIVFITMDNKQNAMISTIYTDDFNYIKQFRGTKNFIFLGENANVIDILMLIWLLVFLYLFVFSFFKSYILLKKVIKSSIKIQDARLNVLLDLQADLNIKTKIILYESNVVNSPLLTGFFKPIIIIPICDYGTNEWRMIFKHELYHYKSHDLLFRLIMEYVQKIHWFNPIIYVFSLKFYEMSELVCDQKTVSNYNKIERTQYARLLNNMTYERGLASLSLGFSNSYRRMKRRIFNIMNFKKGNLSITFVLAALCLGISCPVISYASTATATKLEDSLIALYQQETDSIKNNSMSNSIIQDNSGLVTSSSLNIIGRASRGNNPIQNYILAPTGEARFSPVSLYKGSKVKIGIASLNSSDSYIGGIVNEQGQRTYVYSSNGVISYTFSVSEAGDYEIFFEGKNGEDGEDICLNGSITIEY